eukprot:Gb_00312 [translate_table: standard]
MHDYNYHGTRKYLFLNPNRDPISILDGEKACRTIQMTQYS